MSSDEAKPVPTEYPERPVAYDLSSFACPRCGENMSGDHYGPCQACVMALRSTQVRAAAAGAVETAAYEPKMNVTPNAVALKDD